MLLEIIFIVGKCLADQISILSIGSKIIKAEGHVGFDSFEEAVGHEGF